MPVLALVLALGIQVQGRRPEHGDVFHFTDFDRQVLELQIESFTWNRDQLQFVPDSTRTGFAEGLDLPEWAIVRVDPHVGEVKVMRSDVPYSRYVLEIEVQRKSGFYIWKVLLPLSLANIFVTGGVLLALGDST